MTRAQRQCGYCGLDLVEDRSRFEVRVAADYQPKPEAPVGTYCSAFCWEAAKVRKSVDAVAKSFHQDCETVLAATFGEEGKI